MPEPDPPDDKSPSSYKLPAKEAGPAGAAKGAIGCALIALGFLIVFPSGLCTAILGVAMIANGFQGEPELASLLIIAVPLTVIGGAIFYAGMKLRKK